VTESDRLFLGAMMTGALTKAYLIDQFYFPPNRSTYWDLRECRPQLYDRFNCAILYNYYVALVDRENWPPSHEVWKEYPTIALLKRKKFPVPDLPSGLTGARLGAAAVELKWQPPVGEFYSEIELKDAAGQKVTKVPPGHGRLYAENTSGEVNARLRACNDKGCSDWSPPVVVRSFWEEDQPAPKRSRRYLVIGAALLGAAIILLCIRKFDKRVRETSISSNSN
jgi:hypothetical protein